MTHVAARGPGADTSTNRNAAFRDIACVEHPMSPEAVREGSYFLVNPDVRAVGMAAAAHFREYGRQEGRLQAVNEAEVRALREAKLSRVRFRRPPSRDRRAGDAMDFLTDDLVREFRIPQCPPVSSNDYGGLLVDRQRANPQQMFLDLGAGLRSTVSSNLINMDVFAAVSTDVVCIGEDLPFEDAQFDFVLCAATLEHTRRPWDVAREICRVLKPGGTVRIDYPFLQPVHGYPSHYFNATPEGTISLFERYCDIEASTVDAHNHPMHALRWLLEVWRDGLPAEGRAEFEAMTVADLLSRPAQDRLGEAFCHTLGAAAQRIIPAGSTLVGIRKPGRVVAPAPREPEGGARALWRTIMKPRRP